MIIESLCTGATPKSLSTRIAAQTRTRVPQVTVKKWVSNTRKKLRMPEPGAGRTSNKYKQGMKDWHIAQGSPAREAILGGCLNHLMQTCSVQLQPKTEDLGAAKSPSNSSIPQDARQPIREEMEADGWMQMGALPIIHVKVPAGQESKDDKSGLLQVWTGKGSPDSGAGKWVLQQFKLWTEPVGAVPFSSNMDSEAWNTRYSTADHLYGEEPNAFIVEVAVQIPAGPVLCLAEGEGRNAVYLATLGHQVTAVDQSEVGLAKARRLAETQGVEITTVVADLTTYDIAVGAWTGIIATFAHLPPEVRHQIHRKVVAGLQPGGVFILEAYTPAQLAFDTGGPKEPELLMTLDGLREELVDLEFQISRELERDVIEGTGHTGRGAVVQILARRL